MTEPSREVRGEFQGRPYVVRLAHRSESPEEQHGAPKWWVLEFDGSRIVLMTAAAADKPEFVLRRAEERLRSIFG
jgi:hypothetical protein